MFFLKKKPFGYQDYLYYLDYLFLPGNFFSNVLITTLPALPALPDYFSPKTLDSVPQDWPYLSHTGGLSRHKLFKRLKIHLPDLKTWGHLLETSNITMIS